VGGYSVPISSVPWQASIQEHGIHQCGAAIYSDQILITAAHCFPQHPYGYTVRVGSTNRNFGGQVAEIANIIVHEGHHETHNISINDIAVIKLSSRLRMDDTVRSIPLADITPPIGSPASVSGWGRVGYNQPQSDILRSYDIALIRLQSKLTMNSRVSAIPLAGSSPESGSPATVSGWGALEFNKELSFALREVDVDIMDQKQCLRSYGRIITQDMICAAAPGKDACSGDSGGPLVSDGQLIGIVSFGTECAHPKYPGVYANVAELKPWILSSVERL